MTKYLYDGGECYLKTKIDKYFKKYITYMVTLYINRDEVYFTRRVESSKDIYKSKQVNIRAQTERNSL